MHMNLRTHLLLLILTLAAVTDAGATRNIIRLGFDRGLSNNYVMDIAQDRNGFVWISTESGLNRYDGSSFRAFKKEGRSAPSANELNRIYADTVGNVLWIATQRHGLDRLDCGTYELRNYLHDADDPASICSDGVTDVAPDPAGHGLWVSTYTDGLDRFDPSTGIFEHFNTRTLRDWPDNQLWCVAVRDDGTVLTGHVGAGLTVLDPVRRKVRNYRHNPADPRSIPGNEVRTVLIDSYRNIWVGTDEGLALFDDATGTFTRYVPDDYRRLGTSAPHNIMHLAETRDGRLWVSTENGGVRILDIRSSLGRRPADVRFARIDVQPDGFDGMSVSNKTIHCVFEDSFGNIWIGTYGDGLDVIAHRDVPFERIHTRSLPVTATFNSVMSLCSLGDTLVAGTDGAGIDIFGRDRRLGNIRPSASNLPGDAVLSLAADPAGNLWAGTYAGGVAIIDRRGQLRDISPRGVSDVRALKVLRNGDVLAGCSDGLVLYGPDGHIRRTLYRSEGAIVDDWIRTVHERPDGSIWVGSFGGGISVYDRDFRLIRTLRDWEGLPSNTVYHMVEAEGGGVWAATGDGLALVSDSVRVDTVIGMSAGLADPCVRALCYDLDGNLWLSTTSGISRLDTTGRLSNYGPADGVAGGDFYGGSVAATPDGRISFGSHSGVYSFDPVEFRSDSSIVAPVISGITVYGADAKDEPYEIYSPGRTVTLPYNQNSLQLDFNVLDPSLTSAVNYRYRVDGIDGRWYPVTPGTGLSLRNLSPGEYTVTVEASLRNRFEVAATTSLDIVVVPPVWATWWARLIYFIIAVIVALVAFRFYKKRLALEYELALERRNNRHTERLNAERMRFFTNITHELRTPLTLILGPIEDMKTDRTMSAANTRRLTVIHKSALHLLQLINTILEFRRTETQNRDLKVTHADLAATVAEIGRRYSDLNTNGALTVDTEIVPGDYVQWFDPEVISMIVDNLMSNACKYTSSGRVILRLRHSCESGVTFTEISVEDTGIGMSQETLRHIFDRYYRDHRAETRLGTGIGLALVCNLVRIHEGEIFVDSELDRGSVFTFRIHTDSTYPEAGRRLDAVRDTAGLPAPEVQAQPGDERPLILIVEDNADIVNYISDSLADSYRTVAVPDGAEGLAKASEIFPDMIISDIMMPRMDGISMVRALKTNPDTEHIPVIFVTAKIADEARREAYEAGADSFLTKPFSAVMLRSRIRNIFDIRRSLAGRVIARGLGSAAQTQTFEATDVPDTKDRDDSVIVSEMSRRDADFILKVESVIKDNISNENLDVAFIADAVCMSHSTLYRKIKAITGLTIAGLVRKLRAREAAVLLENDRYTVSEIAFMVGMGNPGNFRQCFREEFGMTPSEYRTSQRK